MLFGYIGDEYGRLVSLRHSTLLMAFASTLLGCLPGYNTIGNLLDFVFSVFVKLIDKQFFLHEKVNQGIKEEEIC